MTRLISAVILLAAALLLAAFLQGRGFGQPAPLPAVALRQFVTGLSSPVQVTHTEDRSGRLFVVEQGGRIRIVKDSRLLPRPFLDITGKVTSGGEMGLLSVAFHPRYADTGRFYVNYTTGDGDRLRSVVAEYRVSQDADVARPAERVLFELSQPFRNHNGGLNLFGPDGMLYIGFGDGGSAGDPMNNGQRFDTLLGKILRIDVDGATPYRVPPDNPFAGRAEARGEIWAYGLRNPWRFSFDRATGRLFVADVGQNRLEEVDIVERGKNYGWRIMEGASCFNPASGCNREGLELPVAEYDHAGGCSITGGYVYRGTRIPGLVGRYLFGDYCSGRIWALTDAGGNRWTMTQLLSTDLRISSFGEDAAGEVYVVDHSGTIYLITAR
ncbi:MAG TPA: PQQ-dependent sugar dehydrogenase [bacterium]